MSRWRKALLGGGGLLVLAGAVLALGSATHASGQGTAGIGVAPASKDVLLDGNTFSLDINVSDVNNLGAFDFTVTFDNEVLEYIGLDDGEFLSSTGRTQTCIRPAGGPNGEPREAMANQYGALHYGCSTNGLISGGDGKQGPSGSGTLATLTFRPKAQGKGDVQFVGLEQGAAYVIGPANAPVDAGFTGLAGVETCVDSECSAINIDVDEQNGSLRVCMPNEPCEPPPTPTKVPHTAQPITQQTVDAALGTTPSPRNGTPSAGGSNAIAGGSNGNDGSGPSGTIAGAGAGRGTSGSGSSAAAAAARGANGAPVAGYGPQPQQRPSWPRNTGIALGVLGALGIAGGYGVRRRREA